MFVDPMPDRDVLAQMYGVDYGEERPPDPAVENPKEDARVIQLLAERPSGHFLDYGCGRGLLLEGALDAGWQASGVEFDPAVASLVASRTGCTIVSEAEVDELPPGEVDVLHLGDVLEHLTDLDHDFPRILRLVRPGGLLVAQGPLEAQPHLFFAALRLWRAIRPPRPATIPPYHASLATAAGQRALFDRFGLHTQTFDVREVGWPAPTRLTRDVRRSPRRLGLLALRRLSQQATRLSLGRLGNRYFYVGTVP